MAGGGSRGIHAARPTEHRLRSAYTQVAIGGVWSIAHEQHDQKPERRQGQGRGQGQGQGQERTIPMRLLWLLIFERDRPDDANRDLGAGRTQAMWSGQRDMDVALAAPGHGWPMAACPRSIAGVRELRRSRSQTRSKHPWLLGVLFQVTRRRRNASAVRQNPPATPPTQQTHPKKNPKKIPAAGPPRGFLFAFNPLRTLSSGTSHPSG